MLCRFANGTEYIFKSFGECAHVERFNFLYVKVFAAFLFNSISAKRNTVESTVDVSV